MLAIFLAVAFILSRTFDLSEIIFFPLLQKPEIAVVKYFPFSTEESLKEWNEKVLSKSVTYSIESSGSESYVRAISNNSCSALYYKIKLDAKKRPVLSWKWRVNRFPDKKSADNLLNKEEDDFAGRLYVIFSAVFFSKSKALEYIWAEDLEAGTIS
ncbi:MAG: DUF3047 domain-containing protein, partial [Candidatus Omnitrophota bacterium]|nr:DUF3047 domain-containing protein [Candidatus Omnitrophota bacterium]